MKHHVPCAMPLIEGLHRLVAVKEGEEGGEGKEKGTTTASNFRNRWKRSNHSSSCEKERGEGKKEKERQEKEKRPQLSKPPFSLPFLPRISKKKKKGERGKGKRGGGGKRCISFFRDRGKRKEENKRHAPGESSTRATDTGPSYPIIMSYRKEIKKKKKGKKEKEGLG